MSTVPEYETVDIYNLKTLKKSRKQEILLYRIGKIMKFHFKHLIRDLIYNEVSCPYKKDLLLSYL